MAQLKGEERARYVARMFDRISRRYDLLNTVMSGGRHYAWRRKAVEMAIGDLSGPALDVATGTGDFMFDLLAKQAVTNVIGLDFTPRMLAIADNKAHRRGESGRIGLVAGDAHKLPLRDDHFICATVGFGVRNFIDLPRALGEIKRVLRPGGRLVILEIVRSEGNGLWSKLFPLCFRYVTPWVGAILAGDREAYTYLPESVQGFLSAEHLASMMEDAGFSDVTYRKLGMGTVAIHVGIKC